MSKINISVEVDDGLENFLKLLPLAIRNKYMGSLTSAMLKQNEKQIVENITSLTQEILQIAISTKDETILQEELDKALSKAGIIMDNDKKKIRGKKSNPEGFKKSDVVKDQVIEATVFTKDTLGEVEEFKSNDKELNQENKIEEEVVEQELPKEHKPEIDVKKLDLEDMFASNENGK